MADDGQIWWVVRDLSLSMLESMVDYGQIWRSGGCFKFYKREIATGGRMLSVMGPEFVNDDGDGGCRRLLMMVRLPKVVDDSWSVTVLDGDGLLVGDGDGRQ